MTYVVPFISHKQYVTHFLILILILVLSITPLYAFKAGAHAVLSNDIARSLPEDSIIREAMLRYPYIAAWGATGPDLPANAIGITIDHAPWFEKYHYELVGSFAHKLLQVAISNRNLQQIAWAAGWLSHVVGDLYCHGIFVNPDPEVGGVYLANPDTKEMHGYLEAYADKVLYTDKSNPKRTYNVQHMQQTFADFNPQPIADLMAAASNPIYGSTITYEDIDDWMWFFKKIYLNTGVAGGFNFVYNNTYQEAVDHLLDEFGVIGSGPWAGLTRMDRLHLAYDEAVSMTTRLLSEAEQGNYYGFSDAWNLDAYHQDGRSIGTLTVTIRTADVATAGTDDDIIFGLVRDDGFVWRSPVLDKGSGLLGLGGALINDFERGSCETYYIFMEGNEMPINRIREVFLRKDPDGVGGGWKIGAVTVTINGVPYFDSSVNTWLEDGRLLWTAPVMEVTPQRIPVYIELDPDVINDRITLRSYVATGGRVPYSGPATLSVQHKNGTVDSYPVTVGSDGTCGKSVPLSPEDRVQAHVYRPRDNNPQELFVGQTAWIYPKIPYEDIDIHADAFNDRITGTVGGAYHGTVEILVRDTEGAADDRIYRVQARAGEFSLTAPMVGSDGVSAWSFCEGVRLPKGDYMVSPNLDSLEIACHHTSQDQLVGTVLNNAASPSGPYRGDVYLARPGTMDVIGITQANSAAQTGGPAIKSLASPSRQLQNPSSEFSFIGVRIVLSLGYSVWIEHEGLQKFFTYDPTEEVAQEAKKPVELAVVSPLAHVINPVVNPVQQALSLQQSNVAQSSQDAGSYGASPMQMMAPASPSRFAWEGAWETSVGPMILNQAGEIVSGMYGEDRNQIQGKVSGSRLIGVVDEGVGLMGSVDFTPTADGRSFTGVLRYAGETDAELVDGTLVLPLEREGIVANPKNLEGVWTTDCGVLVLDEISGRYRGVCGADRLQIDAKFASGVLQGDLLNDRTGERGMFRLTFNRSLGLFTGYYRYADDEEETPWEGSRLQ